MGSIIHLISVIITWGWTILSIVGVVSCHFSAIQYSWMPFLGLAQPILVGGNVLLLLYWTIRWRLYAVFPITALLMSLPFMADFYRFSNSSWDGQQSTDKELVIASYNVHSFNGEGDGYICRQVMQELAAYHADIICFQEFGLHREFPLDSIKKVFSAWPYYSLPPRGKGFLQLAVFSKYPIRRSKHICYPNSNNNSMYCDLLFDKRPLRVFNNHLQTTSVSQQRHAVEKAIEQNNPDVEREVLVESYDVMLHNFKERDRQAQVLRTLIDETTFPVLVCGDFNSLPSSYAYRMIKGNRLSDGFNTHGSGYGSTFNGFKGLLRIDYILYDQKQFDGVAYQSPAWNYSDHRPVIMKVKTKL